MGYISGSNAMMYHNIGLFILVFSILDEEINLGEYLIRCTALIVVWMMHHVNDMVTVNFGISMVIALIVLVTIWRYRRTIEARFPLRLTVSVIIAIDFWLTLPSHSAGMVMSAGVSLEAIVMFFLMKLSTGRQQNLWAHNRQVAYLANYDKMTNAKNFTTYQKDIFKNFGIARTNRQPLSVAVLDIDHFKLVNDTYGHLAGNQVLTDVAQLLRKTMVLYSESYQFYRTGGEEFALVFPDSSLSEVMQILTYCWRAVRDREFTYNKQKISVTVSIGVTQMVDSDKVPDDIYKRADESLYISKQHGRDAITADGKTQELDDDVEDKTYAYFIKGLYSAKGQKSSHRLANELILRRFDHQQQIWRVPSQSHLEIDTRIELMRDTLVSIHNQVITITLSVASFVSQEVADKLVRFMNSPDGPQEIYIELSQIPAIDSFVPMVEFYHDNGISIIISQISNNRHFEQINASLKYIDGIKLTIETQQKDEGIPQCLKDDIQFWGGITTNWHLLFILDGVSNQEMLDWLWGEDYVDYVEGDYFSKAKLPLLNS